ncbi:hypothetical protein [Natrononativus amylolyticus]|uniref:hypothetical protein n=1 Tax=Natrononativus amylolyticus TaxID=2963434 RepID=UPI0020CF0A8B|nr:hypothetical protein [Natrononativus amylolyticus]
MNTVGDLFARERRSDRPALVDATGRVYDYHWLCTSAWKAGNFLRHSGVRRGVSVGVVGDGPLALLSFFGTALLEGTTRFEPPRGDGATADLRALVAPVDVLESYNLAPGAQRIGYGGQPDDPGVHHLEAGLWSENPSFPPLETDPEAALLAAGERSYSHAAVLAAARDVVDEYGLESGDRVRVLAPLSEPRSVAAGVVAPLLAGAVIELPGGDGGESALAVVTDGRETGADTRRLDCADVSL